MAVFIYGDPKVDDYIIVKAENHEQLVGEVNGNLSRGWVPVGGPFLDAMGDLCQALFDKR